jgi:hypothetical protein
VKYFFIIFLLLSSWMGYGNPSAPQVADEYIKHNLPKLVCQAPPKDALTGTLIDPSNPIFRNSLSPREAVRMAIDANIFKREKDGARLYVIPHKDDNLSDKRKKGQARNRVSTSLEIHYIFTFFLSSLTFSCKVLSRDKK